MTLTTDRLGEEAISQGAEMGASYLDGIKGHGTLQVVRGRNREVIELLGTWRPLEQGTDVTSLEQAADKDEPVRFQGKVDDPESPNRGEVSVDVRISSHAEYTFDATLDEDEEAPTLRVFNFHPVETQDVLAEAA